MRLLLGLMLVLISEVVSAADPWIGQRVFYKDGAVAKVGDKVVDIYKVSFPATVGDVNGDWLWLERAWVRKNDVMTVQAALDFYTEKIRQQPNLASNWSHRGAVWEEKDERDNAIKDYSESIRLDPSRYSPYSNRGNIWYRKGEYDNAIRDYSEAIRIEPQLARAYSNRGAARLLKGDQDIAIRDLTESIRLDPQDQYSYSTRGLAFERQGDFDKALQDYTDAIRVNQKASEPYSARANIWRIKRDFDNAITDLTIAIKLAPESADTYCDRGDIRYLQQQFDAALKDYSQAMKLNPRSTRALDETAILKAACFEDQYRDGKQAVEYATRSCELTDWKSRSSLATLAAACAETGDFMNAIKWQEKVVEMSTDANRPTATARLELYQASMPFRLTKQK